MQFRNIPINLDLIRLHFHITTSSVLQQRRCGATDSFGALLFFYSGLTSWVSSPRPELEPSLVVEAEALNRVWKQRSLGQFSYRSSTSQSHQDEEPKPLYPVCMLMIILSTLVQLKAIPQVTEMKFSDSLK